MNVRLVLGCLMSVLVQPLFGQVNLPGLRVGAGLQGTWLAGDLTAGEDARPMGAGGALTLEFQSEKTVRPQLNLVFGQASAQYRDLPIPNATDPNAPRPNTFVQTNFFAGYLLLQLHPFKDRRIHPVVGAGVGVLSFTPHDRNDQSLVDQLSTRNELESYNTTTVVLPLSVGISAQVLEGWHVLLRYQHWVTATDYLDNVGELGTQSGNDSLSGLQLIFQVDL